MVSNNMNLRKIGIIFLIFTLVFTGMGLSFGTSVSYADASDFVAGDGDDSTAATPPAPGGVGVNDGLISWVDVGKSAEPENGQVTKLQDLAINEGGTNGVWDRNETNRIIPYSANAVNYNPAIQVTSATTYFKKPSVGTIQDTEREVFSVQASNDFGGFPWDLGGKYVNDIKSIYGSTSGKLIRTYFGTDSYKDIDVTGYDLKKTRVMNIWSAKDSGNLNKDQWSFSLDGKQLSPINGTGDQHKVDFTFAAGNKVYIGAGHYSRFNGSISEVIVFNKKLSETERHKVNSYLALKYGLSLKGANGQLIDYVTSSNDSGQSSTMWTAANNQGYGNRITGIGRDDKGALDQKQSKSQDTDANVTIALGATVANSNEENTKEIANDKSFFVFSDNGAGTEFINPIDKDNESLKHTARIYKVEKTNWADQDSATELPAQITFQVDRVETAEQWPLYLVVSADDQFNDQDKFYELVDGKATLSSEDLNNGSYFTIAAPAPKLISAMLDQATANNKQIVFTFDQNVVLTDSTGFSIEIDGTEVPIAQVSIKVDPADHTKLIVTLPSGTDIAGKTVTVSYNGKGNLKGSNGVPVDAFDKDISKLAKPNAQLDKDMLSWGPVDHADNYEVTVKLSDGTSVTQAVYGTELDLSTLGLQPGSYEVTVNAKSDNDAYVDSEASDSVPYTVLKVDKTALGNKVNEAGTLNEKEYTPESWANLELELTEANDVLNDPNATQEQVDAAVTKLTDAIGQLEKIKVDKTALEGKLTEAGKLDKKEYTAESWANLETELAEANTVLNDPNATQEQVDAAVTKLTDAIDQLEKIKVDKTALEGKVTEAGALNEKEYTAESWSNLELELTEANTVLNNPNATQEQVDAAVTKLTDAIGQLEKIKVDKTALEGKVTEAGALNEKEYTAESWLNLELELTEANTVLNNPNATQEQVDAAVTKLTEAIDQLETIKVDKTALEGKVSEAGKLDKKEYTAESWLNLELELTEANTVLNNPNATQEQVDAAVTKLTEAIDQLETIKVDKTALEGKVSEAGKLDKKEYTAESWLNLELELTEANTVLNNPNATQEQVDAAVAKLTEAIGQLEKIKVDKTVLEGKVSEAGKLDKKEYTAESWSNLELELAEANVVLNNPNATQEQVDVAVAKLTDAIDQLEKIKVDKTALEGKVTEAGALNEKEYTAESWLNLELELTEANTVLNNPNATQEQVDAAVTKLTDAIGQLEKIKVDKTALEGKVTEAGALNEKEYTAESWSKLELELTAANDVLNDPAATQVQVDQALAELQKSLDDLIVTNGELQEINLVGLTNDGSKDIPLTPEFDPNQNKNYKGTVTNDVYGISLNPVAKYPDDTQVKITVNKVGYPSDEWNKLPLNEGENEIRVGVYNTAGELINEYIYIIVREKAPGSDNSGGDNGGGSDGSGGNSGTYIPPTPPTPPTTDNTSIITTVNGSNESFATGMVTPNGDQATVTIDPNKLASFIADGTGHKLGIRVPGNGDVEVQGLTLEDLKKIADSGSSLDIEDVLAIYPVPAGQLDVNAISGQFGNAPISNIAVNIKIKRSADDVTKLAREKAALTGYELLVHPVDLDLSFMHDGKTDRAGLLKGYAPKSIALPEGIDPNRITTGVIVNPDGTVFHVPTVVTKINNRYFALINDLRSSGTYSVIWNPQDFADVRTHWGKADVNNIAARLSLKGNGDNTFSPNRSVSRSEFAEIVVTGLGLMRQNVTQADFSDVPASAWYKDSVAIANEFDIVRGYDDGNFKGSQQITREQGFAMIARAYRLIQSEDVPSQEKIASTLASYTDGTSVAAWAQGDVAQLIQAGILQGTGPKSLDPKAQMARAEVTALIARMLKVTELIDK
ncbi:S-layer homology domain-containing protein [Paenibacillus piscarius]|uniref:S-layer homology domain-containing protein n=1 Tax=Paenibacillus piscarius TaxID=1089681 RepID=UPI001EE8BD77|nr:S-layer homology domain-containing protein [Paenibacillus piscarius]